jgi:hypothetical protein
MRCFPVGTIGKWLLPYVHKVSQTAWTQMDASKFCIAMLYSKPYLMVLLIDTFCTTKLESKNPALPLPYFSDTGINLPWPIAERLERGGPCWLLKLMWRGTQRVQLIRVIPWLVLWGGRPGTRGFCSALAALVGPVQNIVSSPYTILIPLSPLPSKLDRQPCRVACLLVCVSGP